MSRSTTEWVLQLVDNITAPMRSVQDASDSAANSVNDVSVAAEKIHDTGARMPETATKIGAAMFMFNQVADAVDRINQEFKNLIDPGVELETRMAKLSTISGKTGDDLDSLKQKAKNLGVEFGVDASEMAKAFMDTIGSLGDSFGESEEALEIMGYNIGTLSKLMDNDAKGAANALSTAMLQYGVDLSKPTEAAREATRMMNVMQAAANVGGSEVVDTAEALRQSGLLAKQSGLSFEELNASLEGLAKGKIVGGEAGTAMRNILLSMSTLGNSSKQVIEGLESYGVNMDLVADPTVKFTDRLRELQKIQDDPGLMENVFMKANIAAGQTILNNIDIIDEWTGAVTGTNAATEGAAVMMDTYAESMSRVDARVSNFKESIFSAIEPIAPFITIMGDALTSMATYTFAIWGISKAFSFLNAPIISAYTSLAMYNGYLSIGQVANLGFARNILQATVALVRFSTVGIFSALKGIGAYVLSLVTAGAASVKFAGIATASFTTFRIAAVSACRAVGIAIKSIPVIGWIIAIISAIIALIAGIKKLWDNCEGFRRVVFATGEVIKAVFYNIGVFFKNLWKHVLKPLFIDMWDIIKGSWTNVIRPVVMDIWNIIKIAGQFIWDIFKWIGGAISGFFLGAWETIKGVAVGIADAVQGMYNWIVDGASGIFLWFSNKFSSIGAWLKRNILDPVKDIFSSVWNFIKEIVNKIIDKVTAIFKPIKELWNKIFPKDQFKDISVAAKEGAEKGSQSFKKSQEEKEGVVVVTDIDPGSIDAKKLLDETTNNNEKSNKDQSKKDDKKEQGLNLAGSGSGGGKTITMNLTMHNHFNGLKNLDEAVDTVVKRINDRLNDALAAI